MMDWEFIVRAMERGERRCFFFSLLIVGVIHEIFECGADR